MAKEYKVVFQATVDASQLQKEADKALKGTKIPFNTKGLKDYGTAAKGSAGMLGEFNAQLKNLSSTIPKVAAFGIATTAINAFTTVIRDGIEAVFEMDAALTEFKKVSDLSGEALDDYIDKATTLGETVARTGSEMMSAATMFKKSGFDEEESLQLAEISAMYQNIADTEIDAGDSASFLISQMKAFNISASDSIQIIDKVNEVANNMSVGTNDLSAAMEVAGSALVTYGNDIDDMIALVTAGTEIMVGRSQQVARGLNTIAGRIVKNQDALAQYGVSIYDANNSLRSTYDILHDLAPAWQTMSDAERVALGETLAGVNQYKVFAAVMSNFSSAVEAHNIALNAAGSAEKENEKAIDSLQGHLNNLKSAFEALANNVISSNFIKVILQAGTAILKFANSDIGQLLIRTVAISQSLKIVIPIIQNLGGVIGNFAASLIDLPSLFRTIKATGVGTMQALTAAINSTTLSVASLEKVTNGLFSLLFSIFTPYFIKGINVIKQSFGLLKDFHNMKAEGMTSIIDEQDAQTAKETAKSFSELMSELNSTEIAITDVSDKLDELHAKDPSELTNREKVLTEEYQKQLDILIAQRDTQKRAAYEAFQESYKGGNGYEYSKTELFTLLPYITGEASDEALDVIWQFYNDAQELGIDFLENMAIQGDEWAQGVLEDIDIIEQYAHQYQNSSNQVQSATQKNAILFDSLSQAVKDFQENGAVSTDTILKLNSAFPDLSKLIFDADGNLTELGRTVLTDSDAMSALVQSFYQVETAAGTMNLSSAKTELAKLEASFYATAISARTMSQAMQISNLRQAVSEAEAELLSVLETIRGAYSTATSGASSASRGTSTFNDQVKELTNSLKEQADVLKQAADLMVSNIDLEIESLQRQKDEIQDVNDAIDDQIELEKALDALARAKSKKVLAYKDGQFQYMSDTAAVGEAQQQLSEVQRKQARQAALDDIDRQIDALKAEQDTWKNVSKAYDEYLGKQALGIDQEAQNWQDRLGQAQAFADEYLKIMQTINAVESKTISVEEGQSILSQSKGFSTTLPKSDSQIINPMQSSSIPTLSTNGSLWNNFIPSSTYGGGTTVVQHFGNIVLPNVTNASQFVEELSNYSQFAVQAATER